MRSNSSLRESDSTEEDFESSSEIFVPEVFPVECGSLSFVSSSASRGGLNEDSSFTGPTSSELRSVSAGGG